KVLIRELLHWRFLRIRRGGASSPARAVPRPSPIYHTPQSPCPLCNEFFRGCPRYGLLTGAFDFAFSLPPHVPVNRSTWRMANAPFQTFTRPLCICCPCCLPPRHAAHPVFPPAEPFPDLL